MTADLAFGLALVVGCLLWVAAFVAREVMGERLARKAADEIRADMEWTDASWVERFAQMPEHKQIEGANRLLAAIREQQAEEARALRSATPIYDDLVVEKFKADLDSWGQQ
jgi:hypothetical protein